MSQADARRADMIRVGEGWIRAMLTTRPESLPVPQTPQQVRAQVAAVLVRLAALRKDER